MKTQANQSWAARLWAAKEDREFRFAAALFRYDKDMALSDTPVGFGLADMAHRAVDAACAEVNYSAVYDKGFSWPEAYTYDSAVERDCMRSENDAGDIIVIWKL